MTADEPSVDSCVSFVVDEMAEISDNAAVAAHDSFLDLGADSVWILRLIQAVEKEYGITIDILDAFQAGSLEDLGRVVWNTVQRSRRM